MSFEPKIPKVSGPHGTHAGQPVADTAKTAALRRRDELAMPDLDAARAAVQQTPKPVVPPGPGGRTVSSIEARFAELERELAKRTAHRARDIQSAITLIGSSAARRSRGARKLALDLCALMDEDVSAEAARIALRLEDALQNSHGGAMLAGLAEAAQLDDGVQGRARALVYAQSAVALTFIAQHEPGLLAEMDDTAESLFERAFVLAEEAMAMEPQLAEAHAALAALVLLQGDPQAQRDAERLTISGFKIEPDHDGCTMALATIRLMQGAFAEALTLVGNLAARGYARGPAQLVAARAHRGLDALDDALQAVQRGLKVAPDLAALHLEACVIAEAREDEALYDEHYARLSELLGGEEAAGDAIAFAVGDAEET